MMITLVRFRKKLKKFLANRRQVQNRKICLFFNRFLLQHVVDLTSLEGLRGATEKIERINHGLLNRSAILELRNSFTWKKFHLQRI